MLENPRDAKRMTFDLDRVPYRVAAGAARKIIVHNRVIGPGKGSTFDKDKGLQRVVAGKVDAPYGFNRADGA